MLTVELKLLTVQLKIRKRRPYFYTTRPINYELNNNNNNPRLLVADTRSNHNQSYNYQLAATQEALNNTTQITNNMETKYNIQISTGIKLLCTSAGFITML